MLLKRRLHLEGGGDLYLGSIGSTSSLRLLADLYSEVIQASTHAIRVRSSRSQNDGCDLELRSKQSRREAVDVSHAPIGPNSYNHVRRLICMPLL